MNSIRNWFSSSQDRNSEGNEDDMITVFQQMGFDEVSARNALIAADGNNDAALEMLLANQSAVQQQQTQESSTRSAASIRAGEAALARHGGGSGSGGGGLKVKRKTGVGKSKDEKFSSISTNATNSRTASAAGSVLHRQNPTTRSLVDQHPNITLPKKLCDKSLEDQVTICVGRMVGRPRTVETFLKTCETLRSNPDHDAYRKLDSSSVGYRNVIAGVPGAEDLLRALKFKRRPNSAFWVLTRSDFDPALFWIAVSSLQKAKNRPEYVQAKQLIEFNNAVNRILSVSTDVEAITRAEFMSKTPTEPQDGRGAVVQVKIRQSDQTFSRRFDGDDQLKDILNWLGGHASEFRSKLISQKWCLIDMNRSPPSPINIEKDINRTLQYIGCWPSGKFELAPMLLSDVANVTSESLGLGHKS